MEYQSGFGCRKSYEAITEILAPQKIKKEKFGMK